MRAASALVALVACWCLLAPASSAQEMGRVRGEVQLAEDAPPRRVDIDLMTLPDGAVIERVTLERPGAFELQSDTTGLFDLLVASPYHEPLRVTVWLGPEPMDLGVTLTPLDWHVEMDPSVRGDFNDWQAQLTTVEMTEQETGRWSATVAAGGVEILGAARGGHTIPPTSAPDLYYLDRGRYAARPSGGDSVRVILDPGLLPRSTDAARISVRGPQHQTALTRLDWLLRREVRPFERALAAAVPDGEEATRQLREMWDWSAATHAYGAVLERLDDEVFRAAATLLYLGRVARPDSAIAARALDRWPEEAVAWQLFPRARAHAAMATGRPAPRAVATSNALEQVPDFRTQTVEGEELTPQVMKGKVVLYDFWATWCAPCLAEMPTLHDAYGRFAERGFEIVSLSLDQEIETLHRFREGDWTMPWLHVYLDEGLESEVAQQFQATHLPYPVLVGRDGEVIGVGREVRGERLIEILERVMEGEVSR